jgi:hypothetical protein
MSSKRNILIHSIQAIVLGLVIGINIVCINVKSGNAQLTDFFLFYQSARFLLEGGSIYKPIPYHPTQDDLDRMTDKAKLTSQYLFPNQNTPLHTLFMLPYATIPLKQGFWLWSIVSLVLGLMAVGFIAFSANSKKNHLTVFLSLAILLFSYFPTIANAILGGQWGLCMLWFVVLIWLTARNEKYVTAGIILGLAMSVKIIFGLYLLYYTFRRNWKIVACSLWTFFILNLIGLFIFGLSTYKKHFLNLETVPQFMNASWNASLMAFFTRIFGGAENIPLIMMPGLAYALASTFSMLIILGIIWSAWSHSKERSLTHYDIGFSLSTVGMLLISPVGWMYYFPILILPAFVIWNASGSLKYKNIYRCSVVTFWLISSIPTDFIPSIYKDMNEPLLWFTSAGYYFYALIAFSLILIIIFYDIKHEKHNLLVKFS